MARVVDVHTHFYPDEYLETLDRETDDFAMGTDEEGRRVILSEGSRIVTLTPEMTDLEARLADMETAGVDHQVISLTAPNVNTANADQRLSLARQSNDAYARINDEYDEFSTLASVPLGDGEAALEEAERAIESLGLHGFVVMSNVLGTPLNDDSFEAFWATVDDLGVPVFVHPTTPAGVEVMGEYRLAPLVGFEHELTMAVARLVFDGVLERHDLDLQVAHLGGTLPYLVERLNNGYRAYPECREHIDRLPETYLAELYYDTVSFHHPSLRCALETFGADHVVTGSDYPHVIGDLERAVTDVEELELSVRDRARIRGENAVELYDL